MRFGQVLDTIDVSHISLLPILGANPGHGYLQWSGDNGTAMYQAAACLFFRSGAGGNAMSSTKYQTINRQAGIRSPDDSVPPEVRHAPGVYQDSVRSLAGIGLEFTVPVTVTVTSTYPPK